MKKYVIEREIAPGAPGLLEIPSIGPTRAKLIQERLGITTVPEVARAAREHRLQTLPGIGPTLEGRIADEAAELLQAADSSKPLTVPATPIARPSFDWCRSMSGTARSSAPARPKPSSRIARAASCTISYPVSCR